MSHGNLLRIVGGSSVLPGTWPWVVSFQFPTREGYKHFCAGSLINSRWVITTAHCFLIQKFLKVDYLRVQIGTTQRSKPGHDSQTRAIKRLVDHEHFKHEEYHNDISLIELDRPVECNDYIQPACLPEEDLEVETLNHCYACGWGITEMKWRAEYADILQEAKVNLISNKICNRSDWYFMKVREENICAVSEEARIDRCKGDGGSPLMCRLPKSERFWVVGLNSWGIGCRAGKVPGVFTATQPFLKWIQGILKDPPESALVPPFKPTPPPTKPPPTRPWTPPAWATAKDLVKPTFELVNGGWYGFGGRRPTYSLPRISFKPTVPRPRTSRGWYKGPKRTFAPYTFPTYQPTSPWLRSTTKFLGWNAAPSIIYRLPRRRTTAKPRTQWPYQRWSTSRYWNRPRA